MIIVMWIFFSALVAIVAGAFNRSGMIWFLVSFIFSPLIGFVALAIAGKPKPKEA